MVQPTPRLADPEALEPSVEARPAEDARDRPWFRRPGPWVAAVLVLLGLALRLFRIGTWSFWVDEVLTIADVRHLFEGPEPYPLLRLEAHAPFYAVEYAFLELLGLSEASARLFPALVGAATLPLLVPWFRRFAGSPGAWAGLFLLAVSPWHVYWSQNARYYTLLLLLQTLALYCFFVGVVEARRRLLVASLALSLGALLTHFTAVTLVATACAFVVLRARARGGARTAAGESGGARTPAGDGGGRTGAAAQRATGVVLFVLVVLSGAVFVFGFLPHFTGISPSWGDAPADLVLKLGYYLSPAVVASAGLGFLLGWRSRREETLFLGLAAVVPLLTVLLLHSTYNVNTRYLFATLPAYLALAAIPVSELWHQRPPARLPLTIGLVVLLGVHSLQEIFLYFTEGHGNREPWKPAVFYARERAAPDERVIGLMDPVPRFYAALPDLPRTRRQVLGASSATIEEIERGGPAWIVVRRRQVAAAAGREQAQPESDGELVSDAAPSSGSAAYGRWLLGNAALIREFPARLGRKDRTVQVYRYEAGWRRAPGSDAPSAGGR